MEKYLNEIANHRKYVKLCEEIVVINERICDLRPVPTVKDEKALDELKKKLQKQFMGKYRKR